MHNFWTQEMDNGKIFIMDEKNPIQQTVACCPTKNIVLIFFGKLKGVMTIEIVQHKTNPKLLLHQKDTLPESLKFDFHFLYI